MEAAPPPATAAPEKKNRVANAIRKSIAIARESNGVIDAARKFINIAQKIQHKRRREKEMKYLRSLDPERCFTRIYEKNHWSSPESRSGKGSSLESTRLLRPQLEALLNEMQIQVFLDASCGDWNWMQHVKFPPNVKYIGGDIVLPMIQQLTAQYGSDKVTFQHLNLIETPFPVADLWMSRDTLFHLSTQDVLKSLGNFSRSQISYALLTTSSEVVVNENIVTGDYRPINLLAPPFNFPKPIKVLQDSPVREIPRVLGLWKREDIAALHCH